MKSGGVGTPKWVAKQMKARGLQRLKWYCQACEKQFRDEHGFRLHSAAPSHRTRAAELAARVPELSAQFESAFVSQLRAMPRHPVTANHVYGEVIKDPHHVHMTATRWRSLAAFIRHLQSTGQVTVVRQDPLIVLYVDVAAAARAQREQSEKQLRDQEQAGAYESVLSRQLSTADDAAWDDAINVDDEPALNAGNRNTSHPDNRNADYGNTDKANIDNRNINDRSIDNSNVDNRNTADRNTDDGITSNEDAGATPPSHNPIETDPVENPTERTGEATAPIKAPVISGTSTEIPNAQTDTQPHASSDPYIATKINIQTGGDTPTPSKSHRNHTPRGDPSKTTDTLGGTAIRAPIKFRLKRK